MTKTWKIAPGEGAEDWDFCRKHGYIGLGWTRLPDYSKFSSEQAVLAALLDAYPRDEEEGCREGAARSIWYFLRRVRPGHVVVANSGRGGIAGIGVVASDYIPPDSSENPIPKSTQFWRRHARRVDWMIETAIDLEETYFFGINAVTSLSPERVSLIRRAYLRKHPGMREQIRQVLGYAYA